MSDPLPKCGLYATTQPIAEVPAGRLVSFHNHGDPGAGVYLPEGWSNNLARFGKRGITLPEQALAHTLTPLPKEGLYVVKEAFTCCEKNCRQFSEHAFIQLGYNAAAEAIVFSPTFGPTGVHLPTSGVKIDRKNFAALTPLVVDAPVSAKTAPVVH